MNACLLIGKGRDRACLFVDMELDITNWKLGQGRNLNARNNETIVYH